MPPALTMPIVMPFLMAWYRKTAWMASRSAVRPRKPNERLETPPEILAPGRLVVIHLVASMKSRP